MVATTPPAWLTRDTETAPKDPGHATTPVVPIRRRASYPERPLACQRDAFTTAAPMQSRVARGPAGRDADDVTVWEGPRGLAARSAGAWVRSGVHRRRMATTEGDYHCTCWSKAYSGDGCAVAAQSGRAAGSRRRRRWVLLVVQVLNGFERCSILARPSWPRRCVAHSSGSVCPLPGRHQGRRDQWMRDRLDSSPTPSQRQRG